ncbi:MAG: hypothetical protein OK457_09320 [Thaumarchaeota archaeon]|nr:hypothetical protein [Nitrososphaerota archaeon]
MVGEGQDSFTPSEMRALRRLKDPYSIQRFLCDLPYHLTDTAWSPRRVLREKTAHCFEGAIFAAAALRVNGFPPLILDFEAQQDADHVLAVYQTDGYWGAIAKSNFTGLRYREPVYRSLRELALSYFEDYFNLRGERTLRRYSAQVNLKRFDHLDWMTTEKPIWFIAEHLTKIHHFPLISKFQANHLHRVDERSLRAGLLGHSVKKHGSRRIDQTLKDVSQTNGAHKGHH